MKMWPDLVWAGGRLAAACRFLASYAQTVDGRVWRFTDQARRVAQLRAATGPGCGRFGVSRSGTRQNTEFSGGAPRV